MFKYIFLCLFFSFNFLSEHFPLFLHVFQSFSHCLLFFIQKVFFTIECYSIVSKITSTNFNSFIQFSFKRVQFMLRRLSQLLLRIVKGDFLNTSFKRAIKTSILKTL